MIAYHVQEADWKDTSSKLRSGSCGQGPVRIALTAASKSSTSPEWSHTQRIAFLSDRTGGKQQVS